MRGDLGGEGVDRACKVRRQPSQASKFQLVSSITVSSNLQLLINSSLSFFFFKKTKKKILLSEYYSSMASNLTSSLPWILFHIGVDHSIQIRKATID